jgi:hypothetical protein
MLKLCKHLKEYENDALLRPVVSRMKDVYLKYWKDIPMLYSFAFILDPRGKLKGFSRVLRLVGKLIGVDYSSYLTEVRAQLNIIYKRYDDKFGAAKRKACPQPPTADKKNSAWDDIFADDEDDDDMFGTPGSGNTFCTPTLTMSRRTSASALLHAACTGASPSAGSSMGVGNELSSYLDSDNVSHTDDKFNIISWWHEHKLSYPVLSVLARDVLSVPVSTVSSESVFSTTGRILEERRRRLSPDMVEILTCVKDWEAAEARLQQQVEDKSLEEECYSELYLDVPVPEEN